MLNTLGASAPQEHTKIYRHELKYFLNTREYFSLRTKLKTLMKLDDYATSSGGYHIRSLYFDNIGDSALYEKQSGILKRKKYRVRIYNLSDDVIKLEKKSRVGQFINKESLSLTREQADSLQNHDYGFLRYIDDKLAREFYYDIRTQLFRPKVIVDYFREAFVLNINRIRITFDNNLKTGMGRTDLFDNAVPMISAVDEQFHILEVKFINMLPSYLKSILQVESHQRLAISKYVYCRKFNKYRNWEDQ